MTRIQMILFNLGKTYLEDSDGLSWGEGIKKNGVMLKGFLILGTISFI